MPILWRSQAQHLPYPVLPYPVAAQRLRPEAFKPWQTTLARTRRNTTPLFALIHGLLTRHSLHSFRNTRP